MDRKLIFEKIKESQLRAPFLNKFFYFDVNEIKKNPELCFSKIENYLKDNKEKISDFEVESWYDEDFKKVIRLKMYLIDEITNNFVPDSLLNNLLPSDMESDIIRERIQNIFLKYEWNFWEENIEDIKQELYYQFNDKIEIIDSAEKDNLPFSIRFENKEYSLNEYVGLVANRGRFQ